MFEGTDAQAEIIAGLNQLETTAMWTGAEIVVWRGVEGGIAFDPLDESWRTLDPPPPPSGVIHDSIAVATNDGLALLVEVETSRGREVNVATLQDGGWRWLETAIPFTDFPSLTLAAAGDWLVAFSAD